MIFIKNGCNSLSMLGKIFVFLQCFNCNLLNLKAQVYAYFCNYNKVKNYYMVQLAINSFFFFLFFLNSCSNVSLQ